MSPHTRLRHLHHRRRGPRRPAAGAGLRPSRPARPHLRPQPGGDGDDQGRHDAVHRVRRRTASGRRASRRPLDFSSDAPRHRPRATRHRRGRHAGRRVPESEAARAARSVQEHRGRYLDPEQTIIIRSTVFPRTCRHVLRLLAKDGGDWHVAYCPERIAQGYAVRELDELPQIVSGCSEEALNAPPRCSR